MSNIKTDDKDLQNSQDVVNKIVLEYIQTNKINRRWKILKRVFFLIILSVILIKIFLPYTDKSNVKHIKHVGLIDIKGNIFNSDSASADNFANSMQDAYMHSNKLQAVILRIDSPGGSPVQADYMYNTISFYRSKYPKIKVYAVCVDICTSAAYYVAAAADKIYANPSSLVGSIGVLYNGFGFVDTMKKLGVERRLMTAGENKGFMDAFSAENPKQLAIMKNMLNIIHKQFIDKVKLGRKNRLHINADTFSGILWTGVQAKEQGLIDGFASAGQLARDIIHNKNMVDYTYESNFMDKISKNIGMSMVSYIPKALNSLDNKVQL